MNTEAQNAEKDPSTAEPVDGEATAEAGAEETAPEPEEPAVPEIPQISFDEYMAKRNEARSNTEIFGQPKATRAVEADIPGVVKAEVKAEDVSVFILGLNKVPKVFRPHSKNFHFLLECCGVYVFVLFPGFRPRLPRKVVSNALPARAR